MAEEQDATLRSSEVSALEARVALRQALGLLAIAILRAFLYDMRDLGQGYRVASFLTLGALLIVVSFAYQKDWLNLRGSAHPPGESLRGDDSASSLAATDHGTGVAE